MRNIIYIGLNTYEIVCMFFFWGFVGWTIEVIDMRIEAGEFQNRGFLHMPICPLYGIAVPILNMLLGRRGSYFLLFFGGIVICTLLEYLAGFLLETFFNAKWWDYSHMRFNYKGRICLRNSILFGVATLLGIGFVYPEIQMQIHKIPAQTGMVISFILVFILLVDIIVSTRRANSYKHKSGENGLFVIFKSHR